MPFVNSEGIRYHSDVDGASFFGIWKRESLLEIPLNEFLEAWEPYSVEVKEYRYSYDNHVIVLFDTWVKIWPSDSEWKPVLTKVFNHMLRKNAEFAWCGGEECFSKEIINERVYACYSWEFGLMCNSGPNEEVLFLTDEQIKLTKEVISNRDLSIGDKS